MPLYDQTIINVTNTTNNNTSGNFDISAIQEITNLSGNDYITCIVNGTLKKIKKSAFGDTIVEDILTIEEIIMATDFSTLQIAGNISTGDKILIVQENTLKTIPINSIANTGGNSASVAGGLIVDIDFDDFLFPNRKPLALTKTNVPQDGNGEGMVWGTFNTGNITFPVDSSKDFYISARLSVDRYPSSDQTLFSFASNSVKVKTLTSGNQVLEIKTGEIIQLASSVSAWSRVIVSKIGDKYSFAFNDEKGYRTVANVASSATDTFSLGAFLGKGIEFTYIQS